PSGLLGPWRSLRGCDQASGTCAPRAARTRTWGWTCGPSWSDVPSCPQNSPTGSGPQGTPCRGETDEFAPTKIAYSAGSGGCQELFGVWAILAARALRTSAIRTLLGRW